MDALWTRGEPATVREIHTELRRDRQIAYTTVLTVMENLLRKGHLRREPAGRANRYAPVTTREEHVARMMRLALEDSGNRAEALMQFVGGMTLDEAAALRSALATYRRRIGGA